jgi:endonuclease I
MSKNFFYLILLMGHLVMAQIPSNYYNSAIGLSGYTLKSQLKTIITNGHVNQGYDGLYDGYVTTDTDHYYENDGTVLDIYSEKPSATDSYNFTHSSGDQCGTYNSEADCYNREHVVPQSVFNEQSPMVSDIHTVIPTDGYVNNRRSNYPFGVVTNPSWTSTNGSKVGSNTAGSYTGSSFEPIDEFKGDVARMMFYFATRYETQVDSWSFAMFNGTEDKVFQDWALTMLLEWHENDPVSQREIDRNNAAFNFQGNANPFISHPEWVNVIWNPTPDTQAPSIPTNLIVSNESSNALQLSWTASTDNVGVFSYDVYKDGSLQGNATTNSYFVTGLAPLTTYNFYVKAKDVAGNISGSSDTVEGTTTDVPSSANELFFSEYIEGISFNKALEIANYTGANINLSIYSIAKNSNGAGGWLTSFPLTGNVINGDVYVLANSSADATILTQSDLSTNNDVLNFNGNDPIGLFKNGILIDVIGVLNAGSADFAKDVTLRRKSNIVNPNTTFNLTAEWDVFPVNTFDGLGNHNQVLNVTSTNQTVLFQVYPNPTSDSITIKLTDNSLQFEYTIQNLIGQIVQKGVITDDTHLNVNHLNNGVYTLNIYTNTVFQTQKLLIEH